MSNHNVNPSSEMECVLSPSQMVAQPEQRRSLRFPVSLKLSYTLGSSASGEGEVCDMSSGGLFFRGGEILPIGKRISVVVQWPLMLDGNCPLKVWIRGRVLRSDRRGTAIELLGYEFRTARVRAASAADSAA